MDLKAEEKTCKNVYSILKKAINDIEECDIKVLGYAIAWDNGKTDITIHEGVYEGVQLTDDPEELNINYSEVENEAR
ncbi:hypothetical protein M2325_001287 [Methanococcus voltae PS]|uniref:Uncharacterized protein n=1 Tax=Methanococcus voltae PS TaxID=523842 RepID=A0ABT2EXA9_METVO|nr:hypothetical protein [Methanococcus voltae]MCS3922591.1 hypothetical protein [Methanococcus voltae PS]